MRCRGQGHGPLRTSSAAECRHPRQGRQGRRRHRSGRALRRNRRACTRDEAEWLGTSPEKRGRRRLQGVHGQSLRRTRHVCRGTSSGAECRRPRQERRGQRRSQAVASPPLDRRARAARRSSAACRSRQSGACATVRRPCVGHSGPPPAKTELAAGQSKHAPSKRLKASMCPDSALGGCEFIGSSFFSATGPVTDELAISENLGLSVHT